MTFKYLDFISLVGNAFDLPVLIILAANIAISYGSIRLAVYTYDKLFESWDGD